MTGLTHAPWTPLRTGVYSVIVNPWSLHTIIMGQQAMLQQTITAVVISRATVFLMGFSENGEVSPGGVYENARQVRLANMEAVRRCWINSTGLFNYTLFIGPSTGEVSWTP